MAPSGNCGDQYMKHGDLFLWEEAEEEEEEEEEEAAAAAPSD